MDRSRLPLALLTALVLSCDRAHPPAEAGIELLAILGDPEGDGALASMPHVSPEINDHYLVTTPDGPPEELVRLYNSAGHFIRLIGRHGEGPNEYRRPEHIHRINDSAWIYDATLRRVTTIRPPDTLGLSRPWQFRPASLLPLPDGTFVISSGNRGSGPPMSQVTAAGERLLAFGDTLPKGFENWRWVHLAAAPDSGFWSAPRFWHLQFQYWSAPAHLVRTLSIKRDYFADYTKYAAPTPSSAPSPTLIGVWVDTTDALWIAVLVPDPQWPSGLGPAVQAEGSTYYPVEDADRVFDTIIERVDSENGATLASWRIDPAVVRVVEPWILQSIRTDEEGWYQALLWQVPH